MEGLTRNVTYRSIDEHYAALDIRGELTAFADDVLMGAFNQALDGGAQGIILNFTKLNYLTSSGIGLLVTLFIRASRAGRQLYAVGLNDHYRRIFELTKLDENIPVLPTENDVLARAEESSGETDASGI